jgi:hypothetical protein
MAHCCSSRGEGKSFPRRIAFTTDPIAHPTLTYRKKNVRRRLPAERLTPTLAVAVDVDEGVEVPEVVGEGPKGQPRQVECVMPVTRIARNYHKRECQRSRRKGRSHQAGAVQATVATPIPTRITTASKTLHQIIMQPKLSIRRLRHAPKDAYASFLPRPAGVGMATSATTCTRYVSRWIQRMSWR